MRCGATNTINSKFCGVCGASLVAAGDLSALVHVPRSPLVQTEKTSNHPQAAEEHNLNTIAVSSNEDDISSRVASAISGKNSVIIAIAIFFTFALSAAYMLTSVMSPKIVVPPLPAEQTRNISSENSSKRKPESIRLDYGQQLARGAEMAMLSGPVCESYKEMIRRFANPEMPENVRIVQIEKIIDVAERAGCRGYISSTIRRAFRRAELPDCSAHTLRHTHASRLIQNGLNLYEVKEILGHADIKTTMRYSHLEQRSVSIKAREVIDRLNKENQKPELRLIK